MSRHPRIALGLSQDCGRLCFYVYTGQYLWGGIVGLEWGGLEECGSVCVCVIRVGECVI